MKLPSGESGSIANYVRQSCDARQVRSRTRRVELLCTATKTSHNLADELLHKVKLGRKPPEPSFGAAQSWVPGAVRRKVSLFSFQFKVFGRKQNLFEALHPVGDWRRQYFANQRGTFATFSFELLQLVRKTVLAVIIMLGSRTPMLSAFLANFVMLFSAVLFGRDVNNRYKIEQSLSVAKRA